MEQILAEETLIDSKLLTLEEKRMSSENRLIDLRSIKAPKDLAQFHSKLRQEAFERNSELLQELDIATGKLHTKRLCPISEKLIELRKKYISKKEERKKKVGESLA